jgi:PilZ domain-containing protein
MSDAPSSAQGPKPASERAVAVSHEKREHPRFKLEGATAVLGKEGILAGLGLPWGKRRVHNLSQGGAMIHVGKALAVGSRHPIKIEIPKFKEVLEGEVEVRWCTESAKKDKDFFAGVAFVQLSAQDRRKIAAMQDLLTSAEYRAKASARKEASSAQIRPTR